MYFRNSRMVPFTVLLVSTSDGNNHFTDDQVNSAFTLIFSIHRVIMGILLGLLPERADCNSYCCVWRARE